ITAKIVTVNPVDTTTLGIYTITYDVNDTAGNSATQVTRVVTVTALVELPSTLKKTGQTTVYVVNDDGTYQTGVAHSYTRDDANDIVTDDVTGLEWQDDAAVETVTKNWADAGTYCTALSLDGGGWRLPTIDELVYITDKGKFDPAIDDTVFQNTASSNYWSSTTDASHTSSAWGVYFYYGNDNWNDKSYSYFVRCVRAGQ
ncbi:MAG: DUF1566 domain-containing protein, partial [Campylobacterota bacterium]|nr:DUF1566 domain-containing protein [Campylobacterota bacterium]